jgi:hypothetical protein
MIDLEIRYRVIAQGLHSVDDEYCFSLSDEHGRKSELAVPAYRGATMLMRIIDSCRSEGKKLNFKSFIDESPASSEDDAARELIAPFLTNNLVSGS